LSNIALFLQILSFTHQIICTIKGMYYCLNSQPIGCEA